MENIKFINRIKETEIIRKAEKNNFFMVVKGRRRIGKTSLLRRTLPDAFYIFIWPNKAQKWIAKQICEEHKIPNFGKISDILEYLIDMNKTIIIDEFQNIYNVDKSIYGEIQKIVDDSKEMKKHFKIAVAGSSYSLMNRVFGDVASPLYGRRTHEIVLYNLPVMELHNALNRPLEDFIKLWAVFEGVPYYYELLDKDKNAEENIKELIISKDAKLQNEGKAILSIEFGQDSKNYNTILTAISEGKTKLSQIASLFDNKSNEVMKYIDILRKDFGLVRRMTPITHNPKKSKDGRYELVDNFLSFWFFFVDKKKEYIEQERFKEVDIFFENNFNCFIGKKFEKLCGILIKENQLKLPFEFTPLERDANSRSLTGFTAIGRQWGRIPKTKETYEIDIVALNEQSNEISFFECKWKDLKTGEALKILDELKQKSQYVN
ncbi:MAG: ATP-binding protein, partial [Candidatus Aenigmarchaeota archaeon]|nr:ATP-binding protein [Candidatus Aenigmarchaeota archaeon]